jgi:outer membrane receptor for ferrienterochelin and colicins
MALLGSVFSVNAQKKDMVVHVMGVTESDTSFLYGASVFWHKTTIGASTNENGIATIPFVEALPHALIVSYIGFSNDTILVESNIKQHYYVFLWSDEMLETLEIVSKKESAFISSLNPIRTDVLNANELKKSACCDLSESFETNASVDVGFTDALTGAKEIQMLGLDGTYVEMFQQRIPALRGLANPLGLSFVPGPWLSTIEISKGAGSILNGHESITGSINYEYKKPFETDPFYLDIFANHMGRYEINALSGFEVGERVGGVIAVNGGGLKGHHDNNGDGFLDQPMYDRFNAMNRWMFTGDKMTGQLSVNYLLDDRSSGEVHFHDEDRGTINAYGFGMKTNRVEAFAKTAFFLPKQPTRNLGIFYALNYHNQKGFFGLSEYDGQQISYNTTALYQTIIKNTDHAFTLGGSVQIDIYDERLNEIEMVNNEYNGGAFVEYTYTNSEKLTIVTGLRLDYNNLYNVQFSPRLHIRYAPKEHTTIRLSAGRGFRTARVLGENISLMASSRTFNIQEMPGIESAWNSGISFVQKFVLNNRHGYFATDFYHTRFQNQVVSDVNEGDNQVNIYNLKGISYANSFLVEASYEIIKGLDVKLAYKLDDVKTTFNGELQPKPFTYLHKGLVTASYLAPKKLWQVDMNLDLLGKQRLPNSFVNDELIAFSPFYIQLGMQVNKYFKNGVEIYVGGENITNYRQKNPIIGAENPFGEVFDTSQIWGPVMGGIFYGGLRYSFKGKKETQL